MKLNITFIRYRVIVLDLLYQMLRETHAIQQRCLALTTNSGRCLRLLSNAVVHLLPTFSKQVSLYVYIDMTPSKVLCQDLLLNIILGFFTG